MKRLFLFVIPRSSHFNEYDRTIVIKDATTTASNIESTR